jgi:hypothetical protein
MKKIILVLTVVIFLTIALMIYPGGNEWHNSSASSSDKDEGLLNDSSGSSGDSSESSASTSKKQKRPEDEAIIIFNEATQNHGERTHLEILARRYEITVDEVIDTVSLMVSNGEIDMDKVLTDRKTARTALARLHKALETYRQNKVKN